jgi:hypothetical protein
VTPRENQDDLYYSEHGDEELKDEYCVMYMEAETVQSEEGDKAEHDEDRKRHITSKDHGLGR